ncbi:MAG: hypothetical protein ACT4OM_11700 [Actinomycetota bacterium]
MSRFCGDPGRRPPGEVGEPGALEVKKPYHPGIDLPSGDELREWHRALSPEPLEAKDERYVILRQGGRDAVDELLANIELSYGTTTQLLSGPSGSGKTTELNRLVASLREKGFYPAIFQINLYISESSPIDVVEFLISLALGAHDTLEKGNGGGPGFAAHFRDMLSRLKVSLDIPGLSLSASSEAVSADFMGVGVEFDLKKEVKNSESVVNELRAKLSFYLGELYAQVAGFLKTLLPKEDGRGSVLIVDGLEKLRGSTGEDQQVQASIETLFVAHAAKVRFPTHHLIYTVPTQLQFLAPGHLPYDARLPVHTPHVVERPGEDAAITAETVRQLKQLVAKRIPVDRILGESQLDKVIQASGGQLRDLFYILRQLMNLILRKSAELPVSDGLVTRAITEVTHEFLNVTAEQLDFFRLVDQKGGKVVPTQTQVPLMAKLIQSHLLLAHLNGEPWYSVHPLARGLLLEE